MRAMCISLYGYKSLNASLNANISIRLKDASTLYNGVLETSKIEHVAPALEAMLERYKH